MSQRSWHDFAEGERLPPLAFPLPVHRLVLAAGANRDFNSIHHNDSYARASGAAGIYANSMFLQGMWERAVRDYIGLAGAIRSLRNFRMNSFNCAGDTVVVHGEIARKWCEGDIGFLEIRLWSMNGETISVGPGSMVVVMPL